MFPVPIDGRYTGPQRLEVSIMTLVPGEIASIVLNVVGLILFNIFPKNRKFPISLLSCLGIANIIYAFYLIAKFDKNLASYGFLTSHLVQNSCVTQVIFNTFFYYTEVCLNTMMAAVLFLTVVKRVDVEYAVDQRYFWASVAFYFLFVIPFMFGYAFAPSLHAIPQVGICESVATKYTIIPLAFLLLIQIVLLTWTFVVVFRIRKSVGPLLGQNDKKLSPLIVRFSVTLCSQFFSVASYFTIFYTGPDPYFSPNTIIFCCIALAMCPNIDASVLIFANKPLQKWIFMKYRGFKKSRYSSSTDLKTSTSSKNIQMSTTKESTTDSKV